MATFNSIQDLVGKPLLAWVSYPYGNSARACFVYPQYVYSGEAFHKIDGQALFPSRGCICMGHSYDVTTEEVRRRFGEVVVIKINTSSIVNPQEDMQDKYFSSLPIKPGHYSQDVEVARLSEHPLAKQLLQVAMLQDGADLRVPQQDPVELGIDDSELTDMLMVESSDGYNLKYYGPFTAHSADDGYILSATQDCRNMVYELSTEQTGELIVVRDLNGDIVKSVAFMQKAPLNAIKKRPSSSVSHDWLSDEELVEALARVMGSAADLKLGSKEVGAITKAIKNCTLNDAKIYVTDQRKKRMEALLSQPKRFSAHIDVLSSALARPEAAEQLMELALSEEYWPEVKGKLMDTEAIAKQVEEEQASYRRATEEAKLKAEEAERLADQLREDAERIRTEVLEDAQASLAEVNAQVGKKRAELQGLQEEASKTEADLALLGSRTEEILSRFDRDASGLVDQLLFGRMACGGAASPAASVASSAEESVLRPHPALLKGEEDLSGMAIVEELSERLSANAGRDLSNEEIINLMVCVMSGNITVLSGLPGTGKTSLVEALAGALGLNTPATRRYTRINVEQGWTSHRDYIGYFNPLTGGLQASNVDTLGDMMALDAECRTGESGALPYLMLLDEANLSVMENYWSPFIANADDALSKPATLNMQGGTPLLVPTNVRWLATVNFDHTTEALSPRFLNRAWVVSTDMSAGDDDMSLMSFGRAKGSFEGLGAFSYAKLMTEFGPQERTLETNQRTLLDDFFRTCADNGAPISWRCREAIARYVATAAPLMRECKASGDIRAVDFALAQRVLPSINGMGTRTSQLLEALQKKSARQLPRTAKLVSHMIEEGNVDGFYQFFC